MLFEEAFPTSEMHGKVIIQILRRVAKKLEEPEIAERAQKDARFGNALKQTVRNLFILRTGLMLSRSFTDLASSAARYAVRLPKGYQHSMALIGGTQLRPLCKTSTLSFTRLEITSIQWYALPGTTTCANLQLENNE